MSDRVENRLRVIAGTLIGSRTLHRVHELAHAIASSNHSSTDHSASMQAKQHAHPSSREETVRTVLKRITELSEHLSHDGVNVSNDIRLHALSLLPTVELHADSALYGSARLSLFRLLGMTFFHEKDYLKACAWFECCVLQKQSFPPSPNDYFNYASSLAHLGKEHECALWIVRCEDSHADAGFRAKPSIWMHFYWFAVACFNGGLYKLSAEYVGRVAEAMKLSAERGASNVELPQQIDIDSLQRSLADHSAVL
ncbi:putative mitochondrial protein [Andalucia godoyi]|uniref:Putative mitochondrial protein n=1 Tax=Andalucia godoyi TaxID=505711 RepID=A0A8K0AID4_ANDGO|nr:putative mitochondrial protein [Andalucia godoyi]|eukprot:ANDGO_02282.mRNA.1 putative mitochondrial protein